MSHSDILGAEGDLQCLGMIALAAVRKCCSIPRFVPKGGNSFMGPSYMRHSPLGLTAPLVEQGGRREHTIKGCGASVPSGQDFIICFLCVDGHS